MDRGMIRNLESNLFLKSWKKYDKIAKNHLPPPKKKHWSIELELVIGTIRKGIKSTI